MRRLITGALIAMLPVAAIGQKGTTAKPCAFDTAAHQRVTDWTVSALAFYGDDTLADAALSRTVGTILSQGFRAPPSISALFQPNTLLPSNVAHDAPLWVFGWLAFTIRWDGRFSNVHWTAPTNDSATTAGILSAIVGRADLNREVLLPYALPPGWKSDVRVLISSDSRGSSAPFTQLRIPMLEVDRGPTPVKRVVPKYPAEAFRAGLQSTLMLEFIVDETGRSVPTSIHLLSATHEEFAQSAANAVINETFRPATIESCPVRTRAIQAFRLSIDRP